MDPDGDDNETVPVRKQMGMADQRGKRKSTLMSENLAQQMKLALEIQDTTDSTSAPFETTITSSDMRQLALVAHNHMKPAMKEFIETYSEVLKKFRITGTNTTMRMCKSLWGEDNPDVEYGLACTSGPLGGDAQIASLMVMEDLGAIIFFVDPLSAHPHQADIDSLIRLANCGNVILCINPTTAMSMMHTFKCALQKGDRGMIPSFFQTLESPAVAEYKRQQEVALMKAINANTTAIAEEEEEEEDLSEDEKEELDGGDEFSPLPARPVRRVSTAAMNLAGIKIEPPKKKKFRVRKIGKSLTKMVSVLHLDH